MTQLKRPLKRSVNQYVIQLEPPIRDEDAIIKIKEKGRRKFLEVTVGEVFWLACRKSAERIRQERKERKRSCG